MRMTILKRFAKNEDEVDSPFIVVAISFSSASQTIKYGNQVKGSINRCPQKVKFRSERFKKSN